MTGSFARFIDAAHAHDISIHSIEASIGGELVYSAGAAGAGPHVPHRMYSVSKSFTALAVLSLAHEGRLRTSDLLMDHFPEMRPVDPLLEEATIAHLLSMRTPYARTTYVEAEGDWLESFFRALPSHRPGTLFHYDTSASYTLSALVERISGRSWEDVVRERVFAPLGLGDGMRMLRGPEGIGHGGSGLIARPRDLLVIAEMLNGAGERRGVRVLPPEVVDALTTRRADTAMLNWGSSLRAGYASQLWLPPGGGWMMFGLGGQIVYGDPNSRRAVVVTANAQACNAGDQRLATLLLDALEGGPFGDAPDAIAWPAPSHDPAHARSIRGTATLTAGENAPDRIEIAASEGSVDLRAGDLSFAARPGMETFVEVRGTGPFAGEWTARGVVTGAWIAPGVFDVRIDASGDEIARRRVRVVISDDERVTVQSLAFGPGSPEHATWQGTFGL